MGLDGKKPHHERAGEMLGMEDTGEATMGKTGEMSLMWRANSTYHRACPAGVPRSGKDGAGHIPHPDGLP